MRGEAHSKVGAVKIEKIYIRLVPRKLKKIMRNTERTFNH